MRLKINIKGKSLKYVTEPRLRPLQGNVTIRFNGQEQIYSKAYIFKALQGLFNDKCIKLNNSIQRLAAIIAEKPKQPRNARGRFVKARQ
jgi:hypothetical protein